MRVRPGDAVLTRYGPGVVIALVPPPLSPPPPPSSGDVDDNADRVVDRVADDDDDGDDMTTGWASVHLWRRVGESIGSCATSTMRTDAVLRRLVASPGAIVRANANANVDVEGDEATRTTTTTTTRLYVVEGYVWETDTYLARQILDRDHEGENDDDREGDGREEDAMVVSLLSSDITSSSCRFHPMMVHLMRRGDEAWDAASRVAINVAARVGEGTPGMVDDVMAGGESLPLAPVADVARTALPNAEEVRRVYDMLRDDDLHDLFRRGRERLRELVESESVSSRTRRTLADMGIEIDDDENENENEDGRSGGSTDGNGTRSTMRCNLNRLRREALSSLDGMMNASLDDVRVRTFADAFDGISRISTSDERLSSIYASISERTRTWQDMTGRLLHTRTMGLFAEGAQRLSARATEVLGTSATRVALGGGGGRTRGDGDANDLTRAFTEGDVAKSKLKGMEMGDAVRRRLFEAIELRSESSGGLDAIIAGSLARAHRGAGNVLGRKIGGIREGQQSPGEDDALRSVVSDLRRSATSAMVGTKESLIALLSRRSAHRDSALLRLERALFDIEMRLGHDLTPERISEIANGEGGTMALFGPIATRAAREIEVQLDAAEARMRESSHWNAGADDVMANVRKITRGELGIVDLLDMAAEYLDDEDVVARSGGLIVKAESLLDTFEAASARLDGDMARGSAVGAGIMDVVAKAGLTKDAVLKGVEGLDVNKLLDDTQTAITDDNARRELISSAGDTALDFLLKILPSVPVPPFDGVREGLVYHLSNLSMAGFKVKKEDVCIEIAGMRAATSQSSQPTTTRAVKASELLIIDIRNISAILDDAVWSFEQTYMPYLKGSGKANTRLWDGAIRLKFELRRRIAKIDVDPNSGNENVTWEPVLCLNDRSCSIGGVELKIQGESRIAWVANKLTSLLGTKLRDYLVIVIMNALTNNSARLIEMLNSNLCNYWEFIMTTAKLKLEELLALEEHHVTKAAVDENEDLVELVWRERLPLGLNILTNDKSGMLKVIDLPRGTQARQVAQTKQLDPDLFKGATIISVNGRRYGPDSQVELFAALKDPARPKAILFKLTSLQNDLDRIDKIILSKDTSLNPSALSGDTNMKEKRDIIDLVTTVTFVDEGDIGLRLTSLDNALSVSVFLRDSRGDELPIEKTGKVMIGDLLSHINGTLVLGANGEGKRKAFSLLEQVGSQRPLTLGFVKPFRYNFVIDKGEAENDFVGGPSELVLCELDEATATTNPKEKKIVLKGFSLTEGAAETGGVLVGDNLAFINGFPVGAGCRFLSNYGKPPSLDDVMRMLKQYTPLTLNFARAQAQTKKTSSVKSYLTSSPLSFDIEAATTFSLVASDYSHLGCRFGPGMNGSDIVVKDVMGIEGTFQRRMRESKLPLVGCKLESIDGEIVPSYVNPQLMLNAINRRWTANGRVELVFSDEKQKDAINRMIKSDGESCR